ncbi:hypothetical protein OEZ85_008869 [Tetradesmus obliquus]|uniref:BZIP domain-containing protein n=1 Tax=Tetradesmus obliquus TaxID=3088 RepID=A0ABY8TPR7_TETOB|nr:hypothetical protein OEZ85_008869 [Tetradesmus obliquus]
MSVQRLKNTIAQLERKKSKRRLAASKLQDEHDQLLLNSRAMDLLVQHQDAVTRMLHAYFQPGAEPLPSIADDTGFIQPVLYEWPLMPEFRAMRLADYNWLLGATVQQVRAKDVNLLTGQQDTPPDSHWERAFCATEASLQQLAVMQQILGHIVPTMEHLEQERQQLAACITSVKALSLHEQSAQAKAAAKLLLQQQQQEEQEKQAVQAEPHHHQQQQQQQQPQGRQAIADEPPAAPQSAVLAAAAAAAAASEAPEVSPAAASVVAADSSSAPDASSSSSSTGRFMQGMCKDMVADMDTRLLKWRTLSGARSAVSFVFRSEQLAALLLASFPYLPMTACMCDYVPAARAAALQREQQRQLLLGQL